ncbi:MBL fold metallo-hydrolase [Thalassobacillus sp. C254]|uniref:MBL fold metallo-hydrolase n=1 Tax=Thalassobacillus sp. C254 TaxID=1225341 RepID=UPI000ABA826D|nr:MBL fold metallo-hydrolase [Thalassobacillus sp. C254]
MRASTIDDQPAEKTASEETGEESPGNEQEEHEKEKEESPEDPAHEGDQYEETERETKEVNGNSSGASEASEELEELAIHFIDAGQADATLFEYSHEGEEYNLLFDAGNWNQNNVVHYLHTHDIETLDVMMLSHPHADHIGQADTIIEEFEVDEVWMSGDTHDSQTFERVMDAVDDSDVSYEEPRAGEIYDIGPLTLEMVNPDSINGDLHHGSLSARFLYGDSFSLLMTGDAEKETEKAMIERGHELEADILQLGHHGSDTSTTAPFLDEVSPETAIYSAGEDNQYGHPHDSVIQRLADRNVEIYGTDIDGTIIVTTDGESYDIASNQDGTISPSSTSDSDTSDDDRGESNLTEESSNDTLSQSEEEVEDQSVQEETDINECIDINSASFEELQEIHQIGPDRAKELESHRPFSSVEEMTRISGIGPARINEIKAEGLACVGG